MTEAMQISVSKETENRIDDSNSTPARHGREPDLSAKPCVETVIKKLSLSQKKRADHFQNGPAPISAYCKCLVQSRTQ
jgi:hypothetical protein